MRRKILIAAFASLSLLAAAQTQSNEKKDTPKAGTEVKSPRDRATGQASGRAAGHVEAQGIVHRDVAAREASTGQASGKAAVADVDSDGKADRTKGAGYDVKSQTKARVAAGDVNGDGAADTTATSNSNSSTKDAAATGVKSPRDAASGMPTGKRQHQPLSISK